MTPTSPMPLPYPSPTNSFWHTQPSKTLLGHRTTKDLPSSADVVIIGSGISGAFAAWEFANLEHDHGRDPPRNVVMLEAREVCSGATGRVGFSVCFNEFLF
jgi:ribulose 1,5-bisphosphate synthetase/thiazole synthase